MTEESTPPQAGPAGTVLADADDTPRAGTGQLASALPDPRGAELEACQFPSGCPNAIEYAGTGRRPKYCYQVVGGVMHDRGNAKRVLDGGAPARRRGEVDDTDATGPRPVTRAQQTVQAQVAGLASRLDEAAVELRDALGNLADPDAVAAEIAAARRTARAEIDQAQAATEEAQARARAAEADAAAARRSAAASDEEVETAGEARRIAETGREQAEAERDELAGQLAGTRAELEATQQALDDAREERDRLLRDLDTAQGGLAAATHDRDEARADRDRIRGELAELARSHEQVAADRDTARARADQLHTERDTALADTAAARRDTDRLELERDRAVAERDARTEERDTARDQAADAGTRLAVAESTVTALREQLERDLERERGYGQQRLDDAEARHTSRERELRAELEQLRTRNAAGESSPQDAPDGSESMEPAAEGAGQDRAVRGGRRSTGSPRPARRRRGANAAPDDDQAADPEGSR